MKKTKQSSSPTNNTKIEKTTNEAQQLLQHLMMISSPLFWHFFPNPDYVTLQPNHPTSLATLLT
jgi:hypothetical protein